MKRPVLWLTVALVPLALVAGFSSRSMEAPPPAPELSLGVMRSCAHLGALARQIALDRAEGITLDEGRYQQYEAYLSRRRTLFRSPDFAVVLAYGTQGLEPETIRNLGVQACVAAYYGFREGAHHKALYREALACQQASGGAEDTRTALNDCMGREYQRLLARWNG